MQHAGQIPSQSRTANLSLKKLFKRIALPLKQVEAHMPFGESHDHANHFAGRRTA